MAVADTKRCNKCGQEKEFTAFHKQANCKDGRRPDCKACRCVATRTYYGRNRREIVEKRRKWRTANRPTERFNSWTYYAKPEKRALRLLRLAEYRAKKFGREIDLDVEFIEEKLRGGVCEATGIPFDFGKNMAFKRRSPFAPSIDRIDAQGGYTKDNVRVVVFIHNAACGDWGEQVVVEYAKVLLAQQTPGRATKLAAEIGTGEFQ